MHYTAAELVRNFFKLNNSPEDMEMAAKLEACMEQQEFANGEILCRIGDVADAMFFIESGKVEILGKDDEPLNELEEGQQFGEYAVLTGDKRLSTVRSKGGTVVFRMESKAVLEGIHYHPSVYGDIIKRLYGQISQKHSKLMRLTSSRRGIVRDEKNQRKKSLKEFLIHYGIVLSVFLLAGFLPAAENPAPVWVLLPIAFLIVYITITKRTLESIVLACLLTMVITYKSGFIFGFYKEIYKTISTGYAVEIMLILVLLGALIKLLSSSGGVNALRRITTERIKSKRGSLVTSLLVIIIVFIDDYLSLFITSTCFVPINDKKRVSREMSTFLIGMTPIAVNTLVPLSIWGVFLTGIITIAVGDGGTALFYQSIPFNFISILVIVLAFLAAVEKLPLVGTLKAAEKRVKEGGPLWPPDSEQFFAHDEEAARGLAINLFLPIFVLIGASIVSGTLEKGEFSVNIGYGLVITLVFMFVFYCIQRLMTPEEFFDNILTGAEHMFGSILLMVLMICFSKSISYLGLIELLSGVMTVFGSGNYWLLPAVLFLLFTAVCYFLGYSWGMYALGLPIAIQLAASVDGNIALNIGAVCAAGVAGDGLSNFQSDNEHFAHAIGCEPAALVNARLPYFIFITILAAAMYLAAGILL
ncbi:MAG: cyclic nucleotide-binding domain-containing protein [Treponema sp.]|jgi:Na+/H+ antiporter NhaC|nr:cyclic nucleotide-binding domain-containing protein [Treponema sp.]